MAVFKVIKGSCPGQLIELHGEQMVIGRHPSCQIVLDNAAVSRNHAQILESHGTYYVEDLRSRNKTYLNGQEVQSRLELTDGDELRVCEVVLRFYIGAPPAAEPVANSAPASNAEEAPASDGLRERGTTVSDHDLEVIHKTGSLTKPPAAEDSSDSSSIITSLDLSSSRSPRIAVRPEAKLRAVMEISQNLARTIKPEDVLPKILESLFKIFPQADRGFVVLKEASAADPVIKAFKARREDQSDSTRFSLTILKEAMAKARAILSQDAATDKRFSMSDSVANLRIRSVMCAPLVSQTGESLGVIQIDTFNVSAGFSEDDLEVLACVALQAALALENAHLHTAALNQRDLERDLNFARQVQLGFLPKEKPRISGYQFYDFYEAAQRVGGDFFDYVPLTDGRVAISVGDVAGKGVPAALLMARIYSDARYELLAKPTPAQAMTSLNAAISSSGLGHRFITMAFVVLDPRAHTLTVVNAGHLPPLLRHATGAVSPLGTDVSSLPLGIRPDSSYKQSQVAVASGDSFLLFTDGVTEAMNSKNDLYSTARLINLVKSAPAEAALLGEAIVADVESFVEELPQRDDTCLICVHRLAR